MLSDVGTDAVELTIGGKRYTIKKVTHLQILEFARIILLGEEDGLEIVEG